MTKWGLCFLGAFALASGSGASETRSGEAMVTIPAGSYTPFLDPSRSGADAQPKSRRSVAIAAYRIDRTPVSNAAFLDFVTRRPEWQRSAVKPLFADERYLASWRSDRELPAPTDGDRPVTEVSWFAAEAYCQSIGGHLPTIDQWEYALDDGGRDQEKVRARSLAWYAKPATTKAEPVDAAVANGYGVAGMVGSVWEWTLDFSSVPGGEEARDPGNRNSPLFCGGGSIGALDMTNYAAYLRFAVRASLKANYATSSLGFRCAAGVAP